MPSDLTGWTTLVGSIVLALFGGGGIAAWIKQRSDARDGVHRERRADIDSLNARAIAIVESQFNFLVKPLQDKVSSLEGNVEGLKVKLVERENRYWKAISHIRVLYTWISRHTPNDLDNTEIPAPPAELVGDI